MSGAGEAAIGHQTDLVPKTFAVQRTGNCEHLAHTRTATRAFVADDNHIAGLDLAFEDRLHCVFFALEYTRWSFEPKVPHTRDFHNAALGSEITFQNSDGAGRTYRL